MKTRNLAIDIISILFILLFTYAALSKLSDFQKFKVQLGQSPLLTNISGLIAWIIPAIEIIIASLIASKKYKIIGMFGALVLMSLFTFYIIAITKFSDYIPCSCGGVLQHMTWNEHLLFNICFVLLAISAIAMEDLQLFFIAIKNRRNRKPVIE
jgi:hypothetical protein